KALVAVDGGREEITQLAAVFEQAAEELAEERAAFLFVPIPKDIAALLEKADMNVAATARLAREGLGHKGEAAACLLRDLLARLFEDDVPVRHFQRGGVAHVHLMLAHAPFALAVFDGDAGGGQLV